MTFYLNNYTRTEKILFLLFLVLKICVLIFFPLTGDEAYFILWGKDISLGYYDHPPVVGWVIYLLSHVSDSYYGLRLFAFFVSIAISLILYNFINRYKGQEIAIYISIVFFLSPLSLFMVILTNDIVLMLFGFMGFYFFSRAIERSSILYAFLAGISLGLAFLSKYLSGVLLIGLLIYVVIRWKSIPKKIVLVTVAIIFLFITENIYYNYDNCWNNIVFNLVSRTDNSTFSLVTVIPFVLSLLFLVSPYGIYFLLRKKLPKSSEFIKQSVFVTMTFLFVFLVISTFKKVGVHWLALYIPFIYLLFSELKKPELALILKFNAFVSIVIAIALLLLSTQYEVLFKNHKSYNDILFYTKTNKICEQLPKNQTIFTSGYTANSVLSYHCKSNAFHVIFNTSKYGREDDKKINFEDYSLQDLLIFSKEKKSGDNISTFFKKIESIPIRVNSEVSYYLIKGIEFNYVKYKAEVLNTIATSYYSPPSWLPVSRCEFKNKYQL